MSYFVYIVLCSDDTLYTGITNDIQRRVEEHNSSKKGAKYTRMRRPVRLVYSIACKDKSTAMQKEREIKKLSREKKLQLIENTDSGMFD